MWRCSSRRSPSRQPPPRGPLATVDRRRHLGHEGPRHLARKLAPDLRRHHLDAEALPDASHGQDQRQRRQSPHAAGEALVIGKLLQLTVPATTGSAHRGGRSSRRRKRPRPRHARARLTSGRSDGAHGGDGEAGFLERGPHALVRIGAPAGRTVISPIRFASAASSPSTPVSAAAIFSMQRGQDALDPRILGSLPLAYRRLWGCRYSGVSPPR